MDRTQTTLPPYAGGIKNRPSQEDQPQAQEVNFYSYLHVIRKRKWVLVFCVIAALSVAFFINVTQRPVYQSAAELILQAKESPNAASPASNSSSFIQDPTFLISQMRLMKSLKLAERIVQKVEEVPDDRMAMRNCFLLSHSKNSTAPFSDKERNALMGRVGGALNAYQIERGARIIGISATCYDPVGVARLADIGAKSYTEVNYETRVESFQRSFLMISKSLAEIREKIKLGETASQKVEAEIQLLENLKIYEEKHPSVIQLRAQIPQLAEKLNQGTENFKPQFTQRADLVPLILQSHIEVQDLQNIEQDLYILRPILKQEVTTNKQMYNSIFKNLQEVELSGGSMWVDAKVIQTASVPSVPIRPNKKMNLTLAFVLGLMIGSGLVFLLEYLDSSIRNLEDVRAYLRLFPLGMVPQVEFGTEEERTEEDLKRMTSDSIPKPFWLANDTGIPLYVAEAYRIIRTNLNFGAVDSTLKVLQITSAVKGEGKTTTSTNLAISLAQAGLKTLLIDADMRRPSIHKILRLEGVQEGLSDALANNRTWESVVEPTSVTNLFCISSGSIPPNPAELLSSKRMKLFIDELRNHFDMIIIDSPPVISVADASVIASRVDGIVLVSRSGFIPRHLTIQARNSLESVNGRLVGCVLNGMKAQHQPYYYYRYYSKYGNYYAENEPQGRRAQILKEFSLQVQKSKRLLEPTGVLIANFWGELLKMMKNDKSSSQPPSRSSGPNP